MTWRMTSFIDCSFASAYSKIFVYSSSESLNVVRFMTPNRRYNVVMLTRRTTFRLYPSKAQIAKLFEARRLHAYLYNACVEHRKTSYQKFGKSIDYYIQQAALVPFKACWSEYKSLNHGRDVCGGIIPPQSSLVITGYG